MSGGKQGDRKGRRVRIYSSVSVRGKRARGQSIVRINKSGDIYICIYTYRYEKSNVEKGVVVIG